MSRAAAVAFAAVIAAFGRILGEVGTSVMLAVKLLHLTSWQWYVLIGSLVTLGVGVAASYVRSAGSD